MAKKSTTESAKRRGKPVDTIDFETALAEVEKVVEQLESGELGLTDSLNQYEKGIEKIKLCHQVLQKAEKRISVLTGVREDGTALVEPVDAAGEPESSITEESTSTGRPGGKKARPPVSDVDSPKGLF